MAKLPANLRQRSIIKRLAAEMEAQKKTAEGSPMGDPSAVFFCASISAASRLMMLRWRRLAGSLAMSSSNSWGSCRCS